MSRPNARPIPRTLPWLVAGLLAVALPAAAGAVYQWKNARGVTQYSDSPPPDRAYESRAINRDGSPAITPVATPVVANADCTNARSNLKVLQGAAEVGLDEDKDGKPDRTLTAQERADRTQRAEAGVKTHCEVALAREP